MIKIAAGLILHLIPILLWVLLGISAGVGAAYYIICGILSIADVISAAELIQRNIRYLHHHKEEVR